MNDKLMVVKASLVKKVGRGGLVLRKHSPEILIGVGIVGVVASTVMACKATLKAETIVDEAQEKINKIKYAKENFYEEEYSEHDYIKDMTIAYTQTGVEFIKLYWPALTLGAVCVGCILGAHGIMRKRNLALVAAYKTVEQSFTDYRNRVISEYGAEKDRQFKGGIYAETITVDGKDENGKKKKTKQEVEKIDPNHHSQYARFFDESSTQWSKTPEYNFTFLKCQQNYANDLLHSRGHLFLNEVYDMIGLPRSQAGAVVGWVMGHEGDEFVDFGIFNGDDDRVRDFVNGYERSILLDFNVGGVIYDLI